MKRVLVSLVSSLVAAVALPMPAHAIAAQAKGPRLIVFGHDGQGVDISRPKQVRHKLHKAPPSFRRYVKRKLRYMLAHSGECPEAYTGVNVARLRTDGFARGDVNQCGGYAVIWKRAGGHWREVIGTQDEWSCQELQRSAVPDSVLDPFTTCWDGSQEQEYHHS